LRKPRRNKDVETTLESKGEKERGNVFACPGRSVFEWKEKKQQRREKKFPINKGKGGSTRKRMKSETYGVYRDPLWQGRMKEWRVGGEAEREGEGKCYVRRPSCVKRGGDKGKRFKKKREGRERDV